MFGGNDIVFYIFFIFIGAVFLHCAYNSVIGGDDDLKCILSSKDKNVYCVRKRDHIKRAANLLAEVSKRCNKLVEHMTSKYPDDERVTRLSSKFDSSAIMETLPTSEHTAYSENKGEKIAFCLNKQKDDNDRLIDVNTLMFVALHELAHIMTVSEGHKQVFWENFKFLLENATQINIYTPVDYKNNNQTYCGMSITDNPYYDL